MMNNHRKAPEPLRKMFFLCDRRACERCATNHCSHTEDIRHAANFQMDVCGNFWEVPQNERAKPVL